MPANHYIAARIVCVPTMWSETLIGVLSVLQEARTDDDPDQWSSVEGVSGLPLGSRTAALLK